MNQQRQTQGHKLLYPLSKRHSCVIIDAALEIDVSTKPFSKNIIYTLSQKQCFSSQVIAAV